MSKTPTVNTPFYGDNLDILRKHIDDESVDLVYLDPPFNSSATYNVLFKSPTGEGSRGSTRLSSRKRNARPPRNKATLGCSCAYPTISSARNVSSSQ